MNDLLRNAREFLFLPRLSRDLEVHCLQLCGSYTPKRGYKAVFIIFNFFSFCFRQTFRSHELYDNRC